MHDESEKPTCERCGYKAWPRRYKTSHYCWKCGAHVPFIEPKDWNPVRTVPVTPKLKPGGSKPYKLYDKKGNFLCAFNDEQQARERVSLLAFNGVTAKLVTE